jgi:LuxR family maltose regulon positive regulatory protein
VTEVSEPEPARVPPVLIRTKLQQPRLRSDLIARPRLVSLLDSYADHKLTLISAAAGYGKTTLLCQWLHDCTQPSV